MRVNNHYLKESSTFKLKLDPALSRFVCIGLESCSLDVCDQYCLIRFIKSNVKSFMFRVLSKNGMLMAP